MEETLLQASNFPIQAVTVYSDRAQVYRNVQVAQLKPGPHVVRLQGISSKFIPDTLQVEGKGHFVLVDISYEHKYENKMVAKTPLITATAEQLALWEEDLAQLQSQVMEVSSSKDIAVKQIDTLVQYLAKATNLPNTGSDQYNPLSALGNDALSGLEQLLKLYEFKTTELKKNIFEFDRQLVVLQSKIQTITSNIGKYNNSIGQRSQQIEIHQINVNIEVDQLTDVDFVISYGVSSASWTPKYDVRVQASDDQKVLLAYKAQVVQITGENWSDVQLTLSTAQPSEGGNAPEFSGFWDINFQMPPPPVTKASYFGPPQASSAFGGAPMARSGAPSMGSPAQVPMVGASFGSSDVREQYVPAPAMKEMTAKATHSATSSTFEVPLKCNIPSDNQPHTVTVARIDLKPQFSYYCCPKLSERVYLKAKIINESDFVLLPGDANVFLDYQFVCKISVPLVATGEDFSISLGADSSIKVKRRPMVKQKESQSSMVFASKTQTVHCYTSIDITNKKKVPVMLRLVEQVPRSSSEKLVVKMIEPPLTFSNIPETQQTANVGESSTSMSNANDKEHVKTGENNIVDWLVSVQPAELRKLTLKFDVTYPNNSPVVEGL